MTHDLMRVRRFRSLFVLVAMIAVLAPVLRAQSVDTIDPGLRARIDTIAKEVLKSTGVPSASIAVVQHGHVAYTQAYGMARLASGTAAGMPATAEMRYAIGSISKQFTAAAILLLQQEGKLSLDDPVGKYLPELTDGKEITIREILSHTSGYQDFWPEDYVMKPMLRSETPQQILETWGKRPLDFLPGTEWQYSNTNFVIAGLIVEKVSGEPLMQFLTEHIFKPLGMESVRNFDEDGLAKSDATGYCRNALGPLRPAPEEGRGWMFGAGELAMTANDLGLWDQSLIAQTVLSPESYEQMFKAVRLKGGKNTHYGLGVQVLERDGRTVIAHTGEVSGFVSANEVLPEYGDAVAVMTNQDAVNAASTIARMVEPLVAGFEPSRTPAEQQALEIYRGLQHGKIDRGLLSPNLNAYFDAQAIADFEKSLGPLGEPMRFSQTASEPRGGMTFRAFEIVYPGKRLVLTTYTYPNGMLEQYLIAPAN